MPDSDPSGLACRTETRGLTSSCSIDKPQRDLHHNGILFPDALIVSAFFLADPFLLLRSQIVVIVDQEFSGIELLAVEFVLIGDFLLQLEFTRPCRLACRTRRMTHADNGRFEILVLIVQLTNGLL